MFVSGANAHRELLYNFTKQLNAIFSLPSANGPREWILFTVTPTVYELNLRSRPRCPTANMPSDGFKIELKSFLSARARRSSFKIYFRFLKDANEHTKR